MVGRPRGGGRRDGSGKITVNEMPAWAVAVANGATVVSSPANASASVGPINDEIGSMSVSLVPTVVGRGVDALVSLEVTKPAVTSGTPAPAEVTMTYFANGAEVKVEGVKIDSSSNPPVAAQMLGLVLARVAVDQDHPAFVVGDKCDFMIRGAHAGRETITFWQQRRREAGCFHCGALGARRRQRRLCRRNPNCQGASRRLCAENGGQRRHKWDGV